MNPLLKHLTVRLWLTVLVGGTVCLGVLPGWQQFFGLNWLILPVIAILLICFLVIGWAFNRLGMIFVTRHINEASVWERAGMMKEAESALQNGVAFFDSFWLSPLLRRQRSAWMMAILARFYLGQTARNAHARVVVADYLRHQPNDETVAEGWLEQLLNRENHSLGEYEAAARIGDAASDHARIQQLLMQFHLANGRSDFDAMQNYLKVWQEQQPLPAELVRSLTRLLLNEGILSHWALQVYISAHQSGDNDALDGIAAAAQWLHPTVENRQDLATARQLAADITPDRVQRLTGRFHPVAPEGSLQEHAAKQINRSTAQTKELARGIADSSRTWAVSAAARLGAWGKKVRGYGVARTVTMSGAVALMAIVFFALGWRLWGRGEAPPLAPPVEQAKPIVEPFTIQVAAYVSAADAQKFVDRLKQHELDAFWTKATSADRTWYQVKVAHFETKEQARVYGQEMKTKGLIDDFYVANYRKPQSQSP